MQEMDDEQWLRMLMKSMRKLTTRAARAMARKLPALARASAGRGKMRPDAPVGSTRPRPRRSAITYACGRRRRRLL